MTTREEIEAACRRHAQRSGMSPFDMSSPSQYVNDMQTLADAYLAERQQRERDQQPPTREMLAALRNRLPVERWWLLERWENGRSCPICDASSDRIKLATIADLRAACLLLGIETEGVL